MKIIIASSYKTDSETGTSQVSQLLAKALSKKNKVIYICLGNKFEKIKYEKNLTYIKIPSLDIGKVAIPLINPLLINKLTKEFDNFKPDIVHGQNSVLVSELVLQWANTNNVPFVVTFHHIPTEGIEHILPKISENILAKLAQEFYTEISLKNFLSRSSGVIALNKSVKKSIRKINKKIKIDIVNNGLFLDKYLNIKTREPNYDKIKFIFLGSYNERKNQKYLVDVFSHLPSNFNCNCYGNIKTGNNYYKKLKEIIAKKNAKNIHLENYLKSNKVLQAFSKADFFISASIKEVQSLAVIQSLAAGKPIIVLDNETTKEFKNENVGLILPKSTPTKVLTIISDNLDTNKSRVHSKNFF